ncbi:MAG: HlyD family efflux transporter periplasmic adaptor subunit [Chlorobi bacterium]|nr:HlyD family efflux transporter periplasmic adaptor subunit [Chlorobiota bacterium]
MDIPIEKKRGLKRKHIYAGTGILILFLLIYKAFFGTNISSYKVKADYLTVDSVRYGIFYNYITVTGNVEPITTIFLDAREGGRVEEKVIEEGEMVKKGDVIIRLSNPDLNLSILNSEAQLAEKSNFLRNTMVVMEQERLQIKRELLNLEYDIKRKKRLYEQDSILYKKELISREEYLRSKEDYEFAVRSNELYIERQKQDSVYRSIQIKQMNLSLQNMELNLKLVRQRKENLNIKAPVDGQLTILEAEPGQNVPKGGRIGKIDVLTSFKVVAKIDEHYIDKVRTGLTAILDRNGKEYKLNVRKVLPDVRNGRFAIEMVFSGTRPDNMRTGQTYYIRLQLGNPEKALLLPRGSFFRETGGQWIYVLSKDGKYAEKRNIKIGKQNPKFYEVLDGLNPGDKVVISDYSTFGNNDRLILIK